MLERVRTGLRPYLSPKYPPMMLPSISPIKIDYVIRVWSVLVIWRSFYMTGTTMDMMITSTPSRQADIMDDIVVIKQ